MPKSVIPKAENTSEVIEANLLKNTFISKRNELLRNSVPLKYRNNLKLCIAQLDNERTGLVQNLNVVLQKSKLNQDDQNQKDISLLYNYKTQEYEKLNNLRKYYTDLDKEISYWQIKNSKKQSDIVKTRLKETQEQYIYGNVEEILIKKTAWYNSKVMKQQMLRHTLDCLLKEIMFKTKIYDSIMCQLEKEGQTLIGVGEEALKSYQEREKAHRDLETFRDINKAEEKQRYDKMYLTTYKLKLDQGLNEFLQKKCRTRYNEHTEKDNKKENLDKTSKSNKEIEFFLKYLINIGGDTDLNSIVCVIKNMNYNKESLFRILILFEQQIMEIENSIRATENIAIKRKETNVKINEFNDCRKKMYMDTIQKNQTILKKKQLFTDNLINLYKELNENINNILQALKISQSSIERSGISGITFEDNMADYFKEIEKKSVEKLIIVNCIENSCTTGLNEDPLSSDAESTENLIIKDYHGVQIKMHKFLNMEDPSTVPIPIFKLDNGFEPSPCPHCMEARFIEDGYCSILSSSKINFLKENPQEMSGVCCTELMKRLDFKNTSPKIAPLMHSKSNCKKTPNLKVMNKIKKDE